MKLCQNLWILKIGDSLLPEYIQDLQTRISCQPQQEEFMDDYCGILGFPGVSDGKKSTCNVGDLDSIPGLGRSSGEWNSYPLHCSDLENSMDRGAQQATYSPWGHKELDTTEQLSLTHSLWDSTTLMSTSDCSWLLLLCHPLNSNYYISQVTRNRENPISQFSLSSGICAKRMMSACLFIGPY